MITKKNPNPMTNQFGFPDFRSKAKHEIPKPKIRTGGRKMSFKRKFRSFFSLWNDISTKCSKKTRTSEAYIKCQMGNEKVFSGFEVFLLKENLKCYVGPNFKMHKLANSFHLILLVFLIVLIVMLLSNSVDAGGMKKLKKMFKMKKMKKYLPYLLMAPKVIIIAR